MAKPIVYLDEPAADPYPIVGDDPSERRGWGVRPAAGSELVIFPTRDQAEEHARQLGEADVVEIDVIIGHAPA